MDIRLLNEIAFGGSSMKNFFSFLSVLCLIISIVHADDQTRESGKLLISLPIPVFYSAGTTLCPFKLNADVKHADPLWTDQGLWSAAPQGIYGLKNAEKKGIPAYDPSTKAFYATANGSLVKIEPDGRLTVILDDVHANDIDVRIAAGMMVARDTDDVIRLYRWKNGVVEKKSLLTGEQYFNPRFSPDGSKILVAESRKDGGHIWIVTQAGDAADLGQGYGASWHPDGNRIIFSRIIHDTEKILASELWVKDTANKVENRIPVFSLLAPVEPAISPDSSWIAFADAHSNDIFMAGLNENSASPR
jgi:hypothetical protein